MTNQLSAEAEQQLVERAKTDEVAFRQLYDLYFTKIYNYVLKRTGHRETAEDIMADTFMKAFVSLERYEYKGVTFGAWLYRIAGNLVIDYYRKNRKYSDRDLDELPELAADFSLEQLFINQETSLAVRKMLSKLPDKDRQVLELKFYAELSNIEISQVMNLSVNNVGVIVFRALKKCQKLA